MEGTRTLFVFIPRERVGCDPGSHDCFLLRVHVLVGALEVHCLDMDTDLPPIKRKIDVVIKLNVQCFNQGYSTFTLSTAYGNELCVLGMYE